VTILAPAPPPHPRRQAHTGRNSRTSSGRLALSKMVEREPLECPLVCERGGRMQGGMQAKGQRKPAVVSAAWIRRVQRRVGL